MYMYWSKVCGKKQSAVHREIQSQALYASFLTSEGDEGHRGGFLPSQLLTSVTSDIGPGFRRVCPIVQSSSDSSIGDSCPKSFLSSAHCASSLALRFYKYFFSRCCLASLLLRCFGLAGSEPALAVAPLEADAAAELEVLGTGAAERARGGITTRSAGVEDELAPACRSERCLTLSRGDLDLDRLRERRRSAARTGLHALDGSRDTASSPNVEQKNRLEFLLKNFRSSRNLLNSSASAVFPACCSATMPACKAIIVSFGMLITVRFTATQSKQEIDTQTSEIESE